VHVYNIIVTGDRPGSYVKKKAPDPALTKTFADEASAVAYYQTVLVDQSLAGYEDDYEGDQTFVDKGNKLTPEIPDTLDKPSTHSKITGSW